MAKHQKRRRIKKARITHISLVRRGANKVNTLFKSDGKVELPIRVKKQADFIEKGLLTALVYVPDMVDSHGDFADAATVEDMCHNFLSNGGHIDVDHSLEALSKDKVRVCETFIVQKGDPRYEGVTDYEGNVIDPTGSWGIVLKLLDSDLRKAYREEGWSGVSMFGMAEVEEVEAKVVDADSAADQIIEALAKKLRGETEEIEMDEKTLLAALEKNNESLLKGLTDALKPVVSKKKDDDDDESKTVIKFEGDPTNKEDVEAHLAKVRLAKIDWDDPRQVAAYLKSIAKDDDDADDDDADDDADDEGGKKKVSKKKVSKEEAVEIKKLKARLAKLEGRSNQGDDDGEGDNGLGGVTGVGEDHLEKVKAGRRMADFINANRGIPVASKK